MLPVSASIRVVASIRFVEFCEKIHLRFVFLFSVEIELNLSGAEAIFLYLFSRFPSIHTEILCLIS